MLTLGRDLDLCLAGKSCASCELSLVHLKQAVSNGVSLLFFASLLLELVILYGTHADIRSSTQPQFTLAVCTSSVRGIRASICKSAMPYST